MDAQTAPIMKLHILHHMAETFVHNNQIDKNQTANGHRHGKGHRNILNHVLHAV